MADRVAPKSVYLGTFPPIYNAEKSQARGD